MSKWATQETLVNQAVLVGRFTTACPLSCPAGSFIVVDENIGCYCYGSPPTPLAHSPSGVYVAVADTGLKGGDIGLIAGGIVGAVVALMLFLLLGFLSYTRITTGSWIPGKKKPVVAIANNPLYVRTGALHVR